MRYPEFLKDGGRIGFIAPSFGCASEPYDVLFDGALKKFRKMGYETVEGENCRICEGIGKSNTPEKCAAEVMEFFTEDRCDVIISCGGGETMCEDLTYIDFEKLEKAGPKWYMGYSDNTNLTFTLLTLCDTASVYGPCVSSFGMEPWHPSIKDAFGIMNGKFSERKAGGAEIITVRNYDGWEKEEPPGEMPPGSGYNITEPFDLKVMLPGKELVSAKDQNADFEFSGRLIGGCLDCLQTLCGTRFDRVREFSRKYRDDGLIWFLESCDLNPMSIRRVLWQLESAGWFSCVKGFMIGRAYRYDDELMGMDRLNAVTGILSKYGVPVLLDADIGHLPPMMPLIEGALATVASENGGLSVNMRLV